MKLADYINGHPEARRLSQLFKRKGYGSYLYGTKKINLKLESGKLNGKPKSMIELTFL